MLARSTIFHWHQQFMQGQASASTEPKSGRLVAASTEITVNRIGTTLAVDDSLSQRQIALSGISYAKRSYGRSICLIGLILSQEM